MKTPGTSFRLNQKLLLLSVLAVFGSAHAESDEIAQLTQPESVASVGIAGTSGESKDRAIFGQYTGLRKDSGYLMLDIDLNKRDNSNGLWTKFSVRNPGLDNRELSISQQKQGEWKYFLGYSEMVRHDPRTINSGLQNSGTTTPSVVGLASAGTGTDINLDIKRKSVSLGGEKWLSPKLMFEATARNETRTGARLTGVGIACTPTGASMSNIPCSSLSAAMVMLTEPIDSTTKQIEFKLNYSGDKYNLSGGYYGSFFSNTNQYLSPSITGNLVYQDGSTLNTGTTPGSTLIALLQRPVALAPDNQAHQFYVSGNYSVSHTTRANFKYAYTHATQNEDFGGASGAPTGVGNLGGAVDTNLMQLGVTSQPMPKLSMLGKLRYEDQADKTPLALYNGAYTNDLNSSKKLTGKVEASYQLPNNLRGTLGLDYETVHRDRPVGTAPIMNLASLPLDIPPFSGLREDTKELGYRAELRRSMSETVNAAVSYIHSKRDGGSWMYIDTNPISRAVGTYPMTMEDRNRDKVRISADWVANDKLSLQFMVEDGNDSYTGPSTKGFRDTGMRSYGVDGSLRVNDKWKLTGYWNHSNQILHVNHNNGYLAEMEDFNTDLGLGVRGQATGKLEVGADMTYMKDNNRYQQSMASGSAVFGGGLPDVRYRVASMKLFGKYALKKNVDARVDLLRQSVSFNEWTWGNGGVPFTYSDNTTVSMQSKQLVTYVGASYIYRFR